MREFADKVDLKIGDVVYWDDRRGFRGTVVGLPTPSTLDVDYDEDIGYGDHDRNIQRSMFTVEQESK